jgi:hypothetical protein
MYICMTMCAVLVYLIMELTLKWTAYICIFYSHMNSDFVFRRRVVLSVMHFTFEVTFYDF